MTSRSAAAKDYLAGLPDDWQVPDPPEREPDMQQDISIFDFRSILQAHLGHRGDLLIAGGGYLRENPRDSSELFVPDCVVAFGVDPKAIVSRNGYVISHAGKPPDFVLEVASLSTGRRDYTVKREGYAGYGVREYWRFDHTGGQFHDAPLAGDVLTGEEYAPLPINRDPDGLIWGHSEVLGLDLCWDNGTLRLRDPNTGSFLSTPEEWRFEMDAAQERAGAAEARAGAAEARAETAEVQAEVAREQAEAAEARAAVLEAELRRLRGD